MSPAAKRPSQMLLVLRIMLTAALLLTTACIDFLWITARDGMAVPAVIFGTAATVLICLGVPLLWSVLPLLALVAVNTLMTIVFALGDMMATAGIVVRLQWIWAALALVTIIVVRLRVREREEATLIAHHERRRETERAEEEARTAERRRAELEYAEEVQRLKASSDYATAPGDPTGYEPQELAAVVLERHAHMHGVPGVGLSAAGFGTHQTKQGQEGEMNFAKALQKDGLLQRFASFWSVHLPDPEIGASAVFDGDVDCVLLSGTTLWLLDMKNYRQGGVIWKQHGSTLSAFDRETGGYVGPKKRKMSENMRMAADRFTARLRHSGLPFEVKPVVVMMPQKDGLGTIEGIAYPGDVPLVGLPVLLDWLRAEPAHDSTTPDGRLLTAMLAALLKDETGRAVIPEDAYGEDAAQKEYREYRRALQTGDAQPDRRGAGLPRAQ